MHNINSFCVHWLCKFSFCISLLYLFHLMRSIVEFPFKIFKTKSQQIWILLHWKISFQESYVKYWSDENKDEIVFRRNMQILSRVLVLTMFYEITIIPSIAFSIANGILGRTSNYFWLASSRNGLSSGFGSSWCGNIIHRRLDHAFAKLYEATSIPMSILKYK